MSAPDTNIPKQVTRHKGPLVGMAAVVVFATLLFLFLTTWVFSGSVETELSTPPQVISE